MAPCSTNVALKYSELLPYSKDWIRTISECYVSQETDEEQDICIVLKLISCKGNSNYTVDYTLGEPDNILNVNENEQCNKGQMDRMCLQM